MSQSDRFKNIPVLSQGKKLDSIVDTQVNSPSISQYFSNATSSSSSFFDEITPNVEGETTAKSSTGPSIQIQNAGSYFDQVGPVGMISLDVANAYQQGQVSSGPDLGIYSNMSMSTEGGVGSEADRRREAWPQIKLLDNDAARLTMPGVTIQEDLMDPVQELVTQLLGESEAAQRRLLGHADVTQDERGIRELIQAGCYRAAVNLTGRLLTIYGQGYGRAGQPAKHSPHSLQLWFTRLALLCKLRCHIICKTETAPFGMLDNPDVFYQHYAEMYPGRVGSMACFAFRLLLAELPAHWGQPLEALDRLHMVLAVIRKILHHLDKNLNEYGAADPPLSLSDKQESIKLWAGREARTMHSIINCALQLKDFNLATESLSVLTKSPHWGTPHMRALHSAWGRVLLQLGNISGAEKQFSKARTLRNDLNAVPDLRDLVDRGLVAVAQNAFQEGFLIFQKALILDPANVMVLNNMGACLLYSGKVKDAISLLEKAVSANPSRGLNESLLLNLCTLYELESSQSHAKKLALLQQINRFKADLTGPLQVCLKLQL